MGINRNGINRNGINRNGINQNEDGSEWEQIGMGMDESGDQSQW
jgi:hypothetical protein